MSGGGLRGRLAPGTAHKAKEVLSALGFQVTMLLSGIVIFPLTARNLGPDDYGRYTTIYVISGFAVTWVHASVGAALVQLILQRNRSARSSLHFGRAQVFAYAVPFGVLGALATVLLFDVGLLGVAVFILATDLLLLGLTQVNLAVIYSFKGTNAIAPMQAVSPFLRTIGVVGLAAADRLTIESLAVNNAVAAVVVFTLTQRAVRRSIDDLGEAARTPTAMREVVGFSALYAGSMATNAVQGEGEKFVLATFRPAAEVGVYQAAYRIVSIALLPLQAVTTAAMRWFLPTDDRRGTQVNKSVRLLIPTSVYCIACGIGIVVAQPVTRAVLGEEFESAVTITVWLCALPLLHAAADIPTMGLLGLGMNRARLLLGIGGAAFALVCYLTMVPPWGWKGAVAATYASEVVSLTAGWMLLRYCQRQRDETAAPAGAAVV